MKENVDQAEDKTPPLRKRILVVCQHFWPENFRINEICRSLDERGYGVDVLCGIPNYPKGRFFKGYNYFRPRRETHQGIHVFRVGEFPQVRWMGKFAVSLNYLLFPLAGTLNLFRLRKRSYDLVLVYSLSPVYMGYPGIRLARKRRIPCITYILDYWPDSLYSVIPIRSPWMRHILERSSWWLYRKSSAIITVSAGMKERVSRDIGISPANVTFIPQSCDLPDSSQYGDAHLKKRFGDRFNIVFTGNIGPAQDLLTLVEAARTLSGETGLPDWRIILVGDGMSKPELEDHVQRYGLSDHVIFEGFKPPIQMPSYYDIADVLYASLAPSPLFEFMIPLKIQAYMASGKPILASIAGEGARVIEEAGCGLTARPGDKESLSNQIVRLTTMEPAKRRIMGANGLRFFIENYEHGKIMDRLEREIRRTVGDPITE